MASSPLIFQAMPPPAARRRPAQFTLPSVLNVGKRLADVRSWHQTDMPNLTMNVGFRG
jgi:hypothetical protein